MAIPEQRWRALFENHLDFLSTHRGTVQRSPNLIQVKSEKKEFTYLIPNSTGITTEQLAGFDTLQIVPWANLFESSFEGFRATETIAYMQLTKIPDHWHSHPGLEIRIAKDKAEMYAFSVLQCKAFLENPGAYVAWAPFLYRANEKNITNDYQVFYVAYEGNQPVGAALAVYNGGIAGLYSASTLPAERRKGIASTITRRLFADAQAKGCTTVTLQVSQGSAAEAFYAKLGFITEFTTPMLSRKT